MEGRDDRDPPAGPLAALLAVLVLVAFGPVLLNGFVDWDDQINFVDNPHFRGLGLAQVAWAWTTTWLGVYQPLGWLALSMQSGAWGLDPRGYHLVSLLMHAANAVILFALTRDLLHRTRPDLAAKAPRRASNWCGLAVALYAVHPLRTEAVAWVSCQFYLPSAGFFLLAILAYLRARGGGQPAGLSGLLPAWSLFLASLLFKTASVSLPVVLVILDIYPLRRLGGGPGRWFGPSEREVWREKWPFVALSLIFLAIAYRAKQLDRALVAVEPFAISSRIAQAGFGVWFYLAKTAWPVGITAYYPVIRRPDLMEPPFSWYALMVLGVSLALYRLRRRLPGLLAAWCAYLVILAPHLGLVPIGSVIAADRYAYIASMAWVPVMAVGLCRLGRPGSARPVAALIAVAGIAAILVMIALTWRHCGAWHDSESLWSHVLTSGNARSAEMHVYLGRALVQGGKTREGLAQYEEALRLKPDDPLAHDDLGLLLLRQGRLEEARSRFAEAVRSRPEFAEAHNNLGMALARQGRLDEALPRFAEAIRLRPGLAEAHNNMGKALVDRGAIAEALPRFAEAIRLRPDYAKARMNLADALARTGRIDEAIAQYREAQRLHPGDADARRGLDDALRSKLRRPAQP